MKKTQHERLVEILRNTATSCHDACTGDWDKSDEGFDALKMPLRKDWRYSVRLHLIMTP